MASNHGNSEEERKIRNDILRREIRPGNQSVLKKRDTCGVTYVDTCAICTVMFISERDIEDIHLYGQSTVTSVMHRVHCVCDKRYTLCRTCYENFFNFFYDNICVCDLSHDELLQKI